MLPIIPHPAGSKYYEGYKCLSPTHEYWYKYPRYNGECYRTVLWSDLFDAAVRQKINHHSSLINSDTSLSRRTNVSLGAAAWQMSLLALNLNCARPFPRFPRRSFRNAAKRRRPLADLIWRIWGCVWVRGASGGRVRPCRPLTPGGGRFCLW